MTSTVRRDSVFANRNFRLLFGGSTISMLGDQFTLVALPWLVLKLTGNPAALGLVLATMALPRALFMLIGGAVVDHLSPRRVLIAARGANALLVAMLAGLVLAGDIRMWLVYGIALGIGLSTAFAYPAASAILPQLIRKDQLQPANALVMGMRQLSMFVGPALAGVVISIGAHGAQPQAVQDAEGLGLAFAIDALSFAFSLGSLLLIRIHSDFQPKAVIGGVLSKVASGVRMIWADLPLRAFMLYAAVVSVFVGGPLQVGLPVLADTRMDLGAASLGILMTANGGGMLLGSFLSGIASRFVRGRLGLMVLTIDSLAGIALATLALVHSTITGAVLLAVTGVLAGIAQIAIVSWIQRRVAPEMMGRAMSVLMFTFMGLGPISAAIAGSLLNVISLTSLFAGAGLLLTMIALSCMRSPALRSIGAARARMEATEKSRLADDSLSMPLPWRRPEYPPIRNATAHKLALRKLSAYFENEPGPGSADGDRFEILATLVEAYEAAHFPIEAPDPIEAIRFRMEQGELTVKDLVPSIGQPNRVYEVLNRKRGLTIEMIRNLHRNPGIPADSLMGLDQKRGKIR